MRKIDKIIVHCSATREGLDFGADDIRQWHVKRGWRDIGYHYVVRLDGTIERGRPLEEVGAHAKGHNTHSIGVCYIGGLDDQADPKDTRTSEQYDSLMVLVATLLRMFPGSEAIGHRDVANRACPCFDAKNEYKFL